MPSKKGPAGESWGPHPVGLSRTGTSLSPAVGTGAEAAYATLTMLRRFLLPLLLLSGCLSSPTAPPPSAVSRQEAQLPPALLSEALLSEVGPQHALLASLAGEWLVRVERPGSSEPVGRGTARLTPLLGERFLQLEVQLTLGEQPLELRGFFGFDRAQDRWQALWLSDMGLGMSLLSGSGRPERGVVLRGEQGGIAGRSVWTVTGPESFRFETYVPGPDGRERLLRTSTYIRR